MGACRALQMLNPSSLTLGELAGASLPALGFRALRHLRSFVGSTSVPTRAALDGKAPGLQCKGRSLASPSGRRRGRPSSVACEGPGWSTAPESASRLSGTPPRAAAAQGRMPRRGEVFPEGLSGRRRVPPPAAKRGGFLAEMESLKEEADTAGSLEFEAPLEVILYPDPRLRAKNRRIGAFDANLDRFADAMLDAMYRTDGVGLSAPQVGVNVQLMVYNPAGERGKGTEYVLVNPRVTKTTRARDVETEGCLSFPGINAEVSRPEGVKVDAQDRKGKKFSLSLTGWQARIFLHEYDHLERTLFFERMSPEVLDSIRPDLLALEDLYQERTGQRPPETVARRLAAA